MTLGAQRSLGLPDALSLKSSNADVVYVAPSGMLTAVGNGDAILFVIEHGEIIGQIPVKVSDASSQTQMLPGDVDGSGDVNVADAVLLARLLAEDKDISIGAQGKINANVNGDANLDSEDMTAILEYLADLRKTL